MSIEKKQSIVVLVSDSVMAKLIESLDPPRIGKNPIFFSLVRAVISQQLSESAASTMFKRLKAITEIAPETLSDLSVESYRACGISTRKAEYIRGISEAELRGQFEHIADLGDDDAIKELSKLRGVGRWTAEMLLIFSLGREDVWPVNDAGLLKAANRLYGTQSVDDFIALGERFKPYRTHAAWYLWASLDKS